MIVNNHILQSSKRSKLDKNLIWGQVLNLSCKALKNQGSDKFVKFQGMIQSDRVGVSVLKQNQETKKKSGIYSHGTTSESNRGQEIPYIHELTQEELGKTIGRCTLVDPGRRDLLYCMHERCENLKDGSNYRYTSNQRAKEAKSRKFKKLRQDMKPDTVKKVEDELSKFPASTVDSIKFSDYIRARSRINETLSTCNI